MGTRTKVVLVLIIVNIILASWWVINGNIFFHTDIARDFLLIEDIVENKNPVLIGPRSGAIPGLFHGPLWLYLTLPAFIMGNGNPVVVGWFWVILFISSLLIIYYVGKKLFTNEIGLLSALLLSSVTILYVRTLFNPYGALILFPLFFYFFLNYLNNQKISRLIISLLTLGFMIQFQMAFGIPILILTAVITLYYIFKTKKYLHLFAFLITLLPLSSFLLFELRNNFLQIRSVIDYLIGTQAHGKLDLSFTELILLRIKEFIVDGIGVITQNNIFLTSLLFIFLLFTFFRVFKRREKRTIYLLFIIFFAGFWLFTIFFKGPLWNYYYIPFIPLLVLIFVSLKEYINRFIFYLLLTLIYFVNLQIAVLEISTYQPNPPEQDISTWQFNKLVAETVFNGSSKEFGYFIFTPDLYGYSPRYAMNFYQKINSSKKVFPYEKKAITYLLIAPPPEYGRDPQSLWYQKNINSDLWKKGDVRIEQEPSEKIVFQNGFIIEKYNLSPQDLSIEPNQNLIKDIFFR